MAPAILVVEDERKIRDLVRGYLERDGHEVFTTASGAEALLIAADHPDLSLVLLDLGLPDVPGEVVARELRRRSDVPIVMLTARGSEVERVAGLEAGADDYVAKPFSPRELVLRIRAILRRSPELREPSDRWSFDQGALVIDQGRHEVIARGEPVQLTPTEWGVLVVLARTPGRVHSRYELINRVRGYEFEGYERTIDSHVKNLRRKLEIDPHEPRIVQTVVGGGYRLGASPDG
ncbi:MAG: response regulator transcription factor [Nitriliruptoraceae bacterium]